MSSTLAEAFLDNDEEDDGEVPEEHHHATTEVGVSLEPGPVQEKWRTQAHAAAPHRRWMSPVGMTGSPHAADVSACSAQREDPSKVARVVATTMHQLSGQGLIEVTLDADATTG